MSKARTGGGVGARWFGRAVPMVALLLMAAFADTGAQQAQGEAVRTEHVRARLVAERLQLVPGGSVDLALVLDIIPGWHTYWRNPGDSGEPPRIRWQLPPGVEAGPIRWPVPKLIRVGPLANYGYSSRATHLVTLRADASWPAGRPIPVRADATWLVCEEECIPERGSFSLTLATSARAGPIDPSVAELFAEARAALPAAGTVGARLTTEGDRVRLSVPAAALPSGITEARFFANAWGLIEPAARQHWHLDGDDLVIEMTAGQAAASAEPSGLLAVTTTSGRRGIEIDAREHAVSPLVPVADVGGGAMSLPLALLFAVLGGLVLNLMPCVFPVLAVKALGLARHGGASRRERLAHGLAYAAGVLTFFGLVALLLLGLRAGGAAVGWGFQLQSPAFVALLAYLFLVLGLGLTGATTLGTRLMGLGVAGPDQGHAGAFMTGALAALVAAPCTAPFMGAALGFAVTQPWPAALTIVLTLGLGMALPLLLLTWMPQLARRLPRPGLWMERLKQLLSFPMFATAAWLVWVLSVQAGPSGVAAVLAGMIALAFALWLSEAARHARSPWHQAASVTAVVGFGLALWLGLALESERRPPSAALASASASDPAADITVTPYSPMRLAEARAAGRPVFVNMTAAWCITCLVNERVALSGDAVARAFADADILYLKGDWTNRDPAITDYLAAFGRNGVPIYVFYPSGGEPKLLPQILTEAVVLAALKHQAISGQRSVSSRTGPIP